MIHDIQGEALVLTELFESSVGPVATPPGSDLSVELCYKNRFVFTLPAGDSVLGRLSKSAHTGHVSSSQSQ